MFTKVSAASLAIAGVGLLVSSVQAAPLAPARDARIAKHNLPVETVQHYHGKHRYCFYWTGWHGPGWYRCGYHLRRGYGWGGPVGWNKWAHPPRKVYRAPVPRHHPIPAPRHYGPRH